MHSSALEPRRVLGSPPPVTDPAGQDAALDLLVDRAGIHDVIMRYAAAVDRRDWAVVESCFHPDVDASGWGRPTGEGRGGLIEFIQGVAHFHTTMHMMGNQFIEVDGDRASLDSYAMLTHHYLRRGAPAEMNMSGNRYVEELTRSPQGWVITRRGGDPVWAPTGVTGVASDVNLVATLRDRAEIHDLLMQYALGIDLRDYERMAGCFAEEFLARYGKVELTDRQALIDFVKGVEHFQSTTHFLSRPWIELSGSQAAAVTYAMISHRPQDGGPEWMTGGPIYRDRLVREHGRWRIAERGVEPSRSPTLADLDQPGPAEARWLADRELIRHTTTRWNLALDLGDRDSALDCLASPFDVALEPEGPGLTDRASMSRALDLVFQRHPAACHWPGNQLVDLQGDHAEVETYVYLSDRTADGRGLTGWSQGARRTVDEMVKQGGRWLISRRRVETNRVS